MDNLVPFKQMNLTVVGVGLMGGSILKALKNEASRPNTITAYDIDKNVLDKVSASGLADTITDDAKTALEDADMVVIALYPKRAIAFLKENGKLLKKGAIVTDICGVKREVTDSIPDILPKTASYVGGHPMAGREHKGFDYSVPDLFLGCKYIITGGAEEAVNRVKTFAGAIGAGKIVDAAPDTHDEMIAYTSQLPHAIAVAYMLCAGERGAEDFSAGSFRDITRVAMINDEMWSELFLENKDKLNDEISRLIDGLNDMKQMISEDSHENLREKMRKAAEMREGIKG